ncbi:TPA: hypothetical protein QEL09_001538 [Stenotrophomonas maltophilia]|nr:hypothetical protein [Stenotrophomonas geniculata]HDS1545181.1 hypothetical protein [Stenotrophomonas maltophilia]
MEMTGHRLAQRLLDAIEHRNPWALEEAIAAVREARLEAWRGLTAFPSLDHPVGPNGITAFHVACMAWHVNQDDLHERQCYDKMAGMLAEAGSDVFAEFGPAKQRWTIIEALHGAAPPSVKAWMASQPFDLHCSASNTAHTIRWDCRRPVASLEE